MPMTTEEVHQSASSERDNSRDMVAALAARHEPLAPRTKLVYPLLVLTPLRGPHKIQIWQDVLEPRGDDFAATLDGLFLSGASLCVELLQHAPLCLDGHRVQLRIGVAAIPEMEHGLPATPGWEDRSVRHVVARDIYNDLEAAPAPVMVLGADVEGEVGGVVALVADDALRVLGQLAAFVVDFSSIIHQLAERGQV